MFLPFFIEILIFNLVKVILVEIPEPVKNINNFYGGEWG